MAVTLFLFATTHDTILAENVARRAGYDAKVVPQPPGRTGRCGVALQVDAGAVAALRVCFAAEGLTDFEIAEG